MKSGIGHSVFTSQREYNLLLFFRTMPCRIIGGGRRMFFQGRLHRNPRNLTYGRKRSARIYFPNHKKHRGQIRPAGFGHPQRTGASYRYVLRRNLVQRCFRSPFLWRLRTDGKNTPAGRGVCCSWR